MRRDHHPILDSDWISEDPAAQLKFAKPQYQRRIVRQIADNAALAVPYDLPERDSKYRAYVRTKGCQVRGRNRHQCMAPIDAAHVEGRGMGTKADDHLTIGLCRAAHMESHAVGWERFEAKYGIDRYAIVAGLLTVWEEKFRKDQR